MRSVNRPTTDLTAYDLYLRAYAVAISSAARFPEALALITQAIARDRNYGPALGYAAICHFRAVTDGWSKDPEADTRQAIDYARRALTFAGDDPSAIAHAATVLASFAEDIGMLERDVIVSINRVPVASPDDIRKIQATLKPGDAVAFRILRSTGPETASHKRNWQSVVISGTLPAE